MNAFAKLSPLFSALLAPYAFAALILYEGFNYPPTDNIADGTCDGGVGFSGPWVNYSAAANSAVVNGSLGFTNQNGAYILPFAGNSLAHTAGPYQYRVCRQLAQSFSGTGTLWVSFLFRDLSPATNNGSVYLQLNNDVTPTENDPAIFVGKKWSTKGFVNRPVVFTTTTADILSSYDQNSTYLLLGRITYTNNSGSSTWWAYRNGLDNLNTNSPPAGGTTVAGTGNVFLFTCLAIANYPYNSTYSQARIDEIRIGDSFYDVVSLVPLPPAKPTNLSPSNAQLNVSLTPTLLASPFSDPNNDSHLTSRWQLAANASFSPLLLDSFSPTQLTNFSVPSGVCSSNRVYFWRVAYLDSRGQWSDWSDPTWFMTPTNPAAPPVFFYDPKGVSLAMLATLGLAPAPWDGSPKTNQLVCIGRDAWNVSTALLPNLETHVSNGGRALIFAQNDHVLSNTFKFRVGKHISRRAFIINHAHPVVRGLDDDDLRDWSGESSLLEPYPYVPPSAPTMKFGWRWGGRGGVCSVPIEKPHRAGWRPILECEFDLAYTPLMELEYMSGIVVLCQLDLEDHYDLDPAARLLARQLLDYVRTNSFRLKIAKTHYVNGSSTVVLITNTLGVICNSFGSSLDTSAALNIVGPGASINNTDVANYLSAGGKIVFAPHSSTPTYGLGISIGLVNNYYGSLSPPTNWLEGAGLSPSDLRFRTFTNSYLVNNTTWDRAADGQLARTNISSGVAIFAQINPDQFSPNDTFFRFTRWRQARALAQILANMGARFRMDRAYFAPSSINESYYHPDYRADFDLGDDPYRYYRW
ncbi:MAG: hypothetical protein N2595_10970 [bacterium]|nr:hypothetical protein [bacterium]